MCQSGPRLKFCTCGGETMPPKPRWRLARQSDADRADTDAALHAVGSIAMPRLEQEMLRDAILADANRADAFDVEIAFAEGDVLTLEFESETLCLVRRDDVWREDSAFGTAASIPLAAGRMKRGR